MSTSSGPGGNRLHKAWQAVHRAFAEFLSLPTAIIIGFLLLAAGSYAVDRSDVVGFAPVRAFMKAHVFADAKATTDLLGTIAGSIITVTSLTITLLLLVVQQTAGSLTSQVFDQFLRRRHNQIYFGFFVGLALYALIVLATVGEPYNPVFGATLALLLTVVALYLMILLVYTTINQMRPGVIIEAVHDHILAARVRQLDLVRGTRRSSRFEGSAHVPVKATRHGYVTHIDLPTIRGATTKAQGEVEIVMRVSIGSHVAFEDVLAQVAAGSLVTGEAVGEVVRRAVHIEQQRDISRDPAGGLEQLEMIAWTSISTSKSNPGPGLLTIRSLRDILARWAAEDVEPELPLVPVVYTDDVPARLMDTLESLAVVSSESMQHQNFIEVVGTVAGMFDRLTADQQRRAEDLVRRILSVLGDHALTAPLDAALGSLVAVLTASGSVETASAVESARQQLDLSVGTLHSRSTRASASP